MWNNFLGETSFPRSFSQDWLLSVDVSETDDQLLVKAEMPVIQTLMEQFAREKVLGRDTDERLPEFFVFYDKLSGVRH